MRTESIGRPGAAAKTDWPTLGAMLLALGLATAGLPCACQQTQPAAAEPCAGATSTYEMSECWGKQFELADAELNRVYKAIMARLPDAEKAKLRDAQRAWIPKKEKKGDEAAAEYEGGTFAPVAKTIALTEATQARTAELKKTYGQYLASASAAAAKSEGAGPGSPPSPAKSTFGESELAGSWIQVKGPTDFESMSLAVEDGQKVFRSYLHDRPLWFGHWQLSGDQLTAQTETGEKLVWTVVSASGAKLVLREDGEDEQTVFKRAK